MAANGIDRTSDENSVNMTNNVSNEKTEITIKSWGFPLDELYKLTLRFYKEKIGTKALELTYQDKLKLIALSKQASFGKYKMDVNPQVGFLDVIGNDRRQAWQALGDMTQSAAKLEFIKMLHKLSPMLKPFIQAFKMEKEENERKILEQEQRAKLDAEEKERQAKEEALRKQQEFEREKQLQQEAQIRAALNQQTAVQFRQYAQQQYPNMMDKQEALIQQLQEQHYQQYMQQVYQQQLLHQQQQQQQLLQMKLQQQQQQQQQQQPQQEQQQAHSPKQQLVELTPQMQNHLSVNDGKNLLRDSDSVSKDSESSSARKKLVVDGLNGDINGKHHEGELADDNNEAAEDDEGSEVVTKSAPELIPASLWTHKDLVEFKKAVRKSGQGIISVESLSMATVGSYEHYGFPTVTAPSMWTRKDIKEFKECLCKDSDSIIKVGSGETVTVRVPTHEDGTCLFWEFATDSYDIGFGVFFEWSLAPGNQVSVHVCESSDEEDEDASEHRGEEPKSPKKKDKEHPPTDEIVSVYRRDSHQEVYCGSHVYPGRGIYLLKFDNSYSLWRAKTLYYRVYYTR